MINDAVAYIKGLAKQRNRNEEWAERAVREAVSRLPAVEREVVQRHVLTDEPLDVTARELGLSESRAGEVRRRALRRLERLLSAAPGPA